MAAILRLFWYISIKHLTRLWIFITLFILTSKTRKKHIYDEALSYFFKTNYQTVGCNPIYGHPGGSNTQISTKNDPKYWYYVNNFPNLDTLILQNSHKNTFRAEYDGISSQLIAKW
jgi:hypothetical protein